MLTESFFAATLMANKPTQHMSSALKDVGVFFHELQPQNVLRHGYKKSSVQPQSLAVSRSHVFAAQSGKAVINVYSRQKGNQEATVPFPEKITSIAYADGLEVLVLGTEEGKLILWEVGTGRISTSTASHLQAVTQICIVPSNDIIISASLDSTVLVWSISSLLSFQSTTDSYSTASTTNAPVATFSQHRDGITALAAGHSRRSTNIAVSASLDRTCHIWHIESCEVLRTVLLPTPPTCVCLDAVDRAVYLGDAAGNVTSVDLLALGQSSVTMADSSQLPVQIAEDEQWRQSSDVGAAHTIALSYDSTALLTGHDNGSILKWDIAKRKVANEVAKLGQPVTNLFMLIPDGIRHKKHPGLNITEIVKPKLEFSAQLENGSTGIPASYKLHAILTGAPTDRETTDDGASGAITSDGWPAAMLDGAARSLEHGASGAPPDGKDIDAFRTERLQEEVAELKNTIAALRKAEMERMERSLARMQKREDIDLRRRQAYHAALERVDDRNSANAAMKAVTDQSKAEVIAIDAESDAEAFGDRMNTK